MKGTEWMENLLGCEAARRNIPLGFQATLPLPGRRGAHTAECWYYRLECQSDGPQVYSPERYVLWNTETMEILSMASMAPVCLGSGRRTPFWTGRLRIFSTTGASRRSRTDGFPPRRRRCGGGLRTQ